MDAEGKPEVLIVTADAGRAASLAAYLAQQQVDITCEPRGDEAFASLRRHEPDAVLIDDGATAMAGREFCRAAREAGLGLAIVVMGRSDDPLDQVLCLEMGADDYVAAHAPWRLLWARLKIALRRAMPPGNGTGNVHTLRHGDFILDRRSLEMRVHGQRVGLTPTEFGCLWLLVERAGTVVSRAELREALGPGATEPGSRAVDTQIFRLRRKLGAVDPDTNRIKSVRPFGYLLTPVAR